MKDYYAILGVSYSATDLEIKRTYRRLAVKYHPDKNPDPQAEALFKEINEAYDTLSDPEKKVFYDLKRQNPFQGVIIEEPPRPRHRDPRYRGTARPAPTKGNRNNLKDLKRKYIPYLGWLCWVGITIPALLFIDYYLPYRIKKEMIVDGYAVGRQQRSNQTHSFKHIVFTTESGKLIKIDNLNEVMLEVGGEVQYKDTWIYGTVMEVSDGMNTITTGHIYGAVAFLPSILFGIAAMGIYNRLDIEFYFSACIVCGVLSFVSLYLILSL